MQLHAANKRQRQSETEITILKAEALQADAAKAAVTAQQRHEKRAATRVAKRPVPGGDTLSAANKYTALNSEPGGEMTGLLNCMR